MLHPAGVLELGPPLLCGCVWDHQFSTVCVCGVTFHGGVLYGFCVSVFTYSNLSLNSSATHAIRIQIVLYVLLYRVGTLCDSMAVLNSLCVTCVLLGSCCWVLCSTVWSVLYVGRVHVSCVWEREGGRESE